MTREEKIKEAILNYCEGIYFGDDAKRNMVKFSVDNLDSMVGDITSIVDEDSRSKKDWEMDARGERNSFRGDMEW
jgi:hypothetical protein